MPLVSINTSRQSTVAVWHTTEDLDILQSRVSVTDRVASTLMTCKPHRRREIIGTRYLLDQILAEGVTILKDVHGRPKIQEYPDLHLHPCRLI